MLPLHSDSGLRGVCLIPVQSEHKVTAGLEAKFDNMANKLLTIKACMCCGLTDLSECNPCCLCSKSAFSVYQTSRDRPTAELTSVPLCMQARSCRTLATVTSVGIPCSGRWPRLGSLWATAPSLMPSQAPSQVWTQTCPLPQ